jgi:hypothetical protein
MVIGAPLGGVLAVSQFWGRQVLIANALLGLPPVVVGLMIYLVLSRSGPLGFAGLLFTPAAMVMAQTVLATPIVIALVHRSTASLWSRYGDLARIDGASVIGSVVELIQTRARSAPDRLPRRVRSRYCRSRCDHYRRQHPRLYAHHDHHHRPAYECLAAAQSSDPFSLAEAGD